MKAEISFDCFYEDDQDNIEGCYRLDRGDWRVFYFTRWYQGELRVLKEAVWRSGITGVDVRHPKNEKLNKMVVIRALCDVLGVTEAAEVRGPDSLQLK